MHLYNLLCGVSTCIAYINAKYTKCPRNSIYATGNKWKLLPRERFHLLRLLFYHIYAECCLLCSRQKLWWLFCGWVAYHCHCLVAIHYPTTLLDHSYTVCVGLYAYADKYTWTSPRTDRAFIHRIYTVNNHH